MFDVLRQNGIWFTLPVIERFASEDGIDVLGYDIAAQIRAHNQISYAICAYFHAVQHNNVSNIVKSNYYSAVNELLNDRDYRRIVFYLPFSELKDAPQYFRETYLRVWRRMLYVYDARGNFYDGDTFEVDARPNGQFECVVKAMHLLPWLLRAEYVEFGDLLEILDEHHDDCLLMQNLTEVYGLIRNQSLLSEAELGQLKKLTQNVAPRKKLSPTYVSVKRQAWLKECEEKSYQLATPNAALNGPFSPNLESVQSKITKIMFTKPVNDVILIGGSRLKGYGTTASDFDVYSYFELQEVPEMAIGEASAAHIYFDHLWLSSSADKDDLSEMSFDAARKYFGTSSRSQALERLEHDLLQYRLLHKGFRRFYREACNCMAADFPEMDGNSPFYDEQFRRLATELFAKYVFIPFNS